MSATVQGPPAFPRAAPRLPELSARLQSMGAGFRRAGAADFDFLRALHHSFREAEMRPVPWTAAQKLAFLDDQFRLQHLHFVTHHPRADFLVAEQSGSVGRLYLDRSAPMWRVVDIGFLPQARGAGIRPRAASAATISSSIHFRTFESLADSCATSGS